MCFFRFDSLTQFCVLFWLSQGRTARTLDLPMKIIGFWAQTQQQREHWSSKARGNELKMLHVKRQWLGMQAVDFCDVR